MCTISSSKHPEGNRGANLITLFFIIDCLRINLIKIILADNNSVLTYEDHLFLTINSLRINLKNKIFPAVNTAIMIGDIKA